MGGGGRARHFRGRRKAEEKREKEPSPVPIPPLPPLDPPPSCKRAPSLSPPSIERASASRFRGAHRLCGAPASRGTPLKGAIFSLKFLSFACNQEKKARLAFDLPFFPVYELLPHIEAVSPSVGLLFLCSCCSRGRRDRKVCKREEVEGRESRGQGRERSIEKF